MIRGLIERIVRPPVKGHAEGPDRYDEIYRKTRMAEVQRDSLTDAQFWLSEGKSLSPEQQRVVSTALTAAGLPSVSDLKQLQAGPTAAAISAYVNYLDSQVESSVKQLYSLDQDQAYNDYPEYLGANVSQITAQNKLLGIGGGAAAAPPPQTFSFQIGPKGEVIRMGSYGAFEIVDVRPELANKTTTTQVNQMTGEAFALTLDADGNVTNRTSLGRVAFPEIDPQQKFRFDVLTAAASVEQSMAGLDLQQRGMMIKALGDDMAHQIEIGAMVYQEAQVNLSRLNTAFTQRREERAQVLKYAVTNASLRRGASGEMLTQLPFSQQLGSILGQATGQRFADTDFQLSAGVINPEQTAQDVLAGSAFSSPIPGLAASLSSSRRAIEGILGKQAGGGAASAEILKMALPNGGA